VYRPETGTMPVQIRVPTFFAKPSLMILHSAPSGNVFS
jgi:hypothetical protein